MTKPDPKEEARPTGPKFRKSVLPADFQIRRPTSPMADILNEAERESAAPPAQEGVPAFSAVTAENAVTAKNAVTAETMPGSRHFAVTAENAGTPEISHPEHYYSVPNEIDDRVMPSLRPTEQAVLRRIYRLTRGFHKATCHVSAPKLANSCNISIKKVGEALNALEARRLINRLESSNKGKKNEERGLLIECLLPEAVTAKNAVSAKSAVTAKNAVTAENADNKEKLLKENLKRENELTLDTKSCPDCQGSGFWYPEGTEKGVAKCRHERLVKGRPSTGASV